MILALRGTYIQRVCSLAQVDKIDDAEWTLSMGAKVSAKVGA